MKKFFAKIVNFLHLLFGGNLDAWINEHVQPSIDFIERLKSYVDSPVANIITALIPGDWAEEIKTKMSDNLGKAIDILLATTGIAAEPDWTNKILQTVAFIKSVSPELRGAMYGKLASILTKLSAGDASLEKVKNHSVDLLVQMQYSKQKENATADNLPDLPADENKTEAPATVVPGPAMVVTAAPTTSAVPDPAPATIAVPDPPPASIQAILNDPKFHETLKAVQDYVSQSASGGGTAS